MMLAIDAGHGLHNSDPRLYDPGAVGPDSVQEATIVLAYALMLADVCEARGRHTVVLTRKNEQDSAPLRYRVNEAIAAGAEALISFHCNASDAVTANGIETLHAATIESRNFAAKVHNAARRAIGLKDRGLKLRTDLAILRFAGPCCLVELGFISNPNDRAAMIYPPTMRAVCEAIEAAL